VPAEVTVRFVLVELLLQRCVTPVKPVVRTMLCDPPEQISVDPLGELSIEIVGLAMIALRMVGDDAGDVHSPLVIRTV
jgi:hypothetical protein